MFSLLNTASDLVGRYSLFIGATSQYSIIQPIPPADSPVALCMSLKTPSTVGRTTQQLGSQDLTICFFHDECGIPNIEGFSERQTATDCM